MEEPQAWPRQTPTPRRSVGRTSASDGNSPEFEFWMVRNPNCPQPNLLSADELFSGGFLLPLHLLRLSDKPPPPDDENTGQGRSPEPESESSAELPDELMIAAPDLSNSKRWRRIFKKNVKKCKDTGGAAGDNGQEVRVKEKRREKKTGGGGTMVSAATELNINLWPFSRSRSAGNGGARPRTAAPARKVSSAPCSRSNSAGESKARKWANSPSRAAGVHLGRSSPVWQVRRRSRAEPEFRNKKDTTDDRRKIPPASKAKVLNLNVPMCIGYRQNLSCRSDEKGHVGVAAVDGGAGEGVRRSNLFNIMSLFTRKVY